MMLCALSCCFAAHRLLDVISQAAFFFWAGGGAVQDCDSDWAAAIRAALPEPEGGFPSEAGQGWFAVLPSLLSYLVDRQG